MEFLEWVGDNICGVTVLFFVACVGIAMVLRSARCDDDDV